MSKPINTEPDFPKLWKDLTPEEKGQLLLANHEGKPIEYSLFGDDYLEPIENPSFSDTHAYRVKPLRKIETLKFFYNYGFGAEVIHNGDTWEPNYKITFETINGEPDLTVHPKMEKL